MRSIEGLPLIAATFVVASAGCATVPEAQAKSAALDVADVARLQMVTAGSISPDGSRIAFTVSRQRVPFEEDSGPSYSELFVMGPDGVPTPFVTGDVSVSQLAWSPDGRLVSFLTKRGDDKHRAIYAIPVGGGEATKIASAETGISSYAWRPDGKAVAFIAKPKKDADRKALQDKGFNQEVVEEHFRAGRVFVAKVVLGTYPSSQVEAGDAVELSWIEGSASSVKYAPKSPDAEGDILVAVAPTPGIDDHYMLRKYEVHRISKEKRLARFETPGKLGMATFSPDGTQVAIVAGADIHDPMEGRIAIGEVSSGTLSWSLVDYLGHVTQVVWSSKDRLIYLAQEGAFSTVVSVSPSDGASTVILEKGQHVIWSMSASDAGDAFSFVVDSPAHPRELYKFSSELKRVTDSNPWLADKPLAKQEVITWKARDGTLVEGILIHPLKASKGPAPLIVGVHGGPESHIRNGWMTYYSYPGQVGAARGFYVLYPNYRGSTGRGVAYSKAGQGDYGGKEFDDILDGIDHLVAAGTVDKKRVGVTGGSYGGFASAWMATKHTERFQASVMFVGISDQVSKFGTTDIPNEMFYVHARKWPWEDWDFFRERSPITYVEQARTPILIMHGKNDTRVHPSQSMELYRYLKTIGKVPVRLVLYPGEGHGNRKSASRLDYNLRLMQWMEHYLMGPGGEPPAADLEYCRFQKDGCEDEEK